MEITAIYKGHTDAEEGVSQSTGNTWRKVLGIFETIEHFPKTIAVTFMNAMCETVFQARQGGLYRIRFDVESRSWTNPKTNVEKWFTDLKGWGMVAEVSQVQGYPAPQSQPAQQAAQPQQQQQQQQQYFGGPLPQGPAPTNDLPF